MTIAIGIVATNLPIACRAQTADFDHAASLFKQKQWKNAAAEFEAAEKLAPGKTDALLYRGKCLVNLGQFNEAADALRSYVTFHPQSDDAAYLLGYVYFREDKPKESLKQYTEAAKLKTPTADDLKIVSLNYVLLSDYTDAAHYLETALKMDPDNVEVRYHLGRVRYQQNHFDQAITAFQEVLKRDPNHVKAEDNLGLSLEGENKIDQAIAAYRRAIDLDASSTAHNEQPYLNLGILLTKANKPAEALLLLTKAAEIDPKSGKIRYQLGKAYFDVGRFPESQREVEEAVRLTPEDAPAHYLLARIYQHLGKQDLSKEQFKLTENLMQAPKIRSSRIASEANQK
jgi:tetratricopeptide (TPR) repeat protein